MTLLLQPLYGAHSPYAQNLSFGAVLGVNSNVPCYSSDYATADPSLKRADYKSWSADGTVYFGYKWQCVELARRWLVTNRGITFESIPMAYDIFDLTRVTQIGDGAELPLRAYKNGSGRRPEVGSMLIWDQSYDVTGHVAIVTEVTSAYVRIVEQNFDDLSWPEGQDYARQLRATVRTDGGFSIQDRHTILGWMVLEATPDVTEAPSAAA